MKFIYKGEVLMNNEDSGDANDPVVDTGEIYSTEETRIGTWIDGKPLYRKVIESVSPTSSDQTATVANVFNVDTFVQIRGFVITNYGCEPVPNFYHTRRIGYGVNGGSVSCSVSNSEIYFERPMFTIVEYTKTTD